MFGEVHWLNANNDTLNNSPSSSSTSSNASNNAKTQQATKHLPVQKQQASLDAVCFVFRTMILLAPASSVHQLDKEKEKVKVSKKKVCDNIHRHNTL
jgi:hypothetical protein